MTGDDPLLAALAEARHRKEQADREIRLLLAFAREISTPRPYRLADLAHAAGMSISGVRVAYSRADVEHAAGLTGACQRRHVQAAVTALLATRQNASAREHDPAA
jgi:hypothetical protein